MAGSSSWFGSANGPGLFAGNNNTYAPPAGGAQPGGLRDSGFGLNFNQGFTSRVPFAFGSTGHFEALQDAQNFQDRQARQKMFEMGQAGEDRRAQIAANATMFPSVVRQQEFGQLFPYLTNQYADLTSALNAGGQTPASPEISVGPVYTPQQIQQQINSTRSSNDASTATQQRQDAQSLAGRGFGSNSPLLQLLSSTRQFAGNQLNAQAQQQIPFQTAQANQEAILKSQQARESQFATRQQEDIARRTPIIQSRTALLSALAGLI